MAAIREEYILADRFSASFTRLLGFLGRADAASRAAAVLRGRDYVVPEDVQAMWRDVAAHRLLPAPGAEWSGRTIAAEVLRTVEPPRIK